MYKYYESTLKYQRTPKGVLNTIYRNQLLRQKRFGIKVNYTYEEFKNKYLNDDEFLKLYKQWIDNDYSKVCKSNFKLQQENQQLKDRIDKVIEFTEELKPHWLGNDMVLDICDELLEILKGKNDE